MLLAMPQKYPPPDLGSGVSCLLGMWELCTFVYMIKTLLWMPRPLKVPPRLASLPLSQHLR